jgi:hypothetical protein
VAEGRSIDEAIDVAKVWKARQPAIPRRHAALHAGRGARRGRARRAHRPRRQGRRRGEPWDEFVTLGLELLHGIETRAAVPAPRLTSLT